MVWFFEACLKLLPVQTKSSIDAKTEDTIKLKVQLSSMSFQASNVRLELVKLFRLLKLGQRRLEVEL